MNSPIHRFGPIKFVTCVGFFVAILPAHPQESFSLQHSLLNPGTNAQAGPQQGYKVAADGNLAVVAAPFDDVAASDSGLVRVYDATTGALLHTLVNPRPAAGDSFGTAVAISGLGVVVGAANHAQDTETPDVGIAYVYDLGRISPTIPVLTLTIRRQPPTTILAELLRFLVPGLWWPQARRTQEPTILARYTFMIWLAALPRCLLLH